MKEKSFPKSDHEIELLINSIDGIVWEADAHTFRFTFVSKKAENILGYPVTAWLSENFWQDHIHPDDKTWAINYCETFTSQNKDHKFEYRMIAKDGSVVWLNDSVTIVSENGQPVKLCGIMIDITEKKKAEEMLRESHRMLVDAELLGKTGHWSWNLKTNKIIWSEGTYRIFGETPGNFKETYDDFFARIAPRDKERVKKIVSMVHQTKRSASYEFWIVTPDNQERCVGTTSEALLDKNGNIASLFGNTIDLTESKRANEKIEKAYEEIRRLTDYLQNVREKERTHIAREIHEQFGQQLTVLKMDTSWLRKRIDTNDEQAVHKLERMISLLDETMKTVRRISYALRPSLLDDLGIVSAIEWHLAEFKKHSGIETEFIYPQEELVLPEAFNIGLYRILQESLNNVALHSNARSVIVDLRSENATILLTISDNGNGFNTEAIKDKPTLGILGMKERAAMMGGVYKIISRPGKGTTTLVSIPEKKINPLLIAKETPS
jgi:PAS domain S-box-containing protein